MAEKERVARANQNPENVVFTITVAMAAGAGRRDALEDE
jgi:hypothetical protein